MVLNILWLYKIFTTNIKVKWHLKGRYVEFQRLNGILFIHMLALCCAATVQKNKPLAFQPFFTCDRVNLDRSTVDKDKDMDKEEKSVETQINK